MTDGKSFFIACRIPATEKELILFLSKIENKNEFLIKLLDDFFNGRLNNTQTKRSRLQEEKLEQEVMRLKLSNKLTLMREMKLSPDEVLEVMKHPDRLDLDRIDKKNSLSGEQWDYVYGCLLDGFLKEGCMKKCLVCKSAFEKDDTARNHLIDNHPHEIKNAVVSMGYKI